MANANTHHALLERYAAIIEQPGGFKMSDLIATMEADYKSADAQLTTKELIHLAITTGYLFKLSALDPKL